MTPLVYLALESGSPPQFGSVDSLNMWLWYSFSYQTLQRDALDFTRLTTLTNVAGACHSHYEIKAK